MNSSLSITRIMMKQKNKIKRKISVLRSIRRTNGKLDNVTTQECFPARWVRAARRDYFLPHLNTESDSVSAVSREPTLPPHTPPTPLTITTAITIFSLFSRDYVTRPANCISLSSSLPSVCHHLQTCVMLDLMASHR